MSENNYDESSTQAWPSFVDILSSTVLVLCFALLVLIIVLSVTRITSATKTLDNESSPSSFKVEADILGDYRAEFQKLSIIANPSLRKEQQVQSDKPVSVDEAKEPIYVPIDIKNPVDQQQEVKEPGDSLKQILGDIPKTVDSKSLEVLKELIIVQRDVISQQRKVIEQQDKEILETTREYQSLLSVITKEKEVEDIRQSINARADEAKFIPTYQKGEKISGSSVVPDGQGTFFLSPPNTSSANVTFTKQADGLRVNFNDNAPFFNEKSYNQVREQLQDKIFDYKATGVVLESKVTDYAISGAEGQRIAVERLLILRSLLIEQGVPAAMIKLKTLTKDNLEEDAIAKGKPVEEIQEDYGWIDIKTNK